MKTSSLKYLLGLSCLSLLACNHTTQLPVVNEKMSAKPKIFPDYKDVVVPAGIAPLRFMMEDGSDEAVAVLRSETDSLVYKTEDGKFLFDESEWSEFIANHTGKDIEVQILSKTKDKWISYVPFKWTISGDTLDAYIAYRLIPPGYEYWNEMGIYQRELGSYHQSAILKNTDTEKNCMNCHSFCQRRSDKFLFHMRAQLNGTYLVSEGKIEKLNGKVNDRIRGLVYPSWHPSGRYVAFSSNDIFQTFHNNDKNRIEVYDKSSDVVVYDSEKHEVVTAPQLIGNDAFETFPTFSADGKRMFFCTAQAVKMPEDMKKAKYSLCAIDFNPETRSFGNYVDTLFNSRITHQSVSFPRVSPNGRFLAFTVSDYGNFSIWHKEADLYMADLNNGRVYELADANSEDVESYHSWSENSRWMVFSSRRADGLYTKPYFTHVDENGKASKPFVLPQEDPAFYKSFMYSYNIPEFVESKVDINPLDVRKVASQPGKGIQMGK